MSPSTTTPLVGAGEYYSEYYGHNPNYLRRVHASLLGCPMRRLMHSRRARLCKCLPLCPHPHSSRLRMPRLGTHELSFREQSMRVQHA